MCGGKPGGKRKNRLRWRSYFQLYIVWLLIWEIIRNKLGYSIPQSINVFYNILSLFVGMGIFSRKINLVDKLERWSDNAHERRKKTRDWKKILLNRVIEESCKYWRPLLKKRVLGPLFVILFLTTPVLAAGHPIANTVIGAQKGAKMLEEALQIEEIKNQREDTPEDDDMVKMEETFGVETKMEDNFGQTKTEPDEVIMFSGDFRLLDEVEKEEADMVRRVILYYDGAYAIKDNDSEKIDQEIEKQFNDLKQGEWTYLKAFFNEDKDSTLTVSKLNEMEILFDSKVDEGKEKGIEYVPDSGELDEIIEGRKGLVCRENNRKLAGQLANDYLRYLLEHNAQGKMDKDKVIYYSGMGILAAQLQYSYAESDEEREAARKWIYQRYKEINDLGLTDDTQRVTDIMEALKNRI